MIPRKIVAMPVLAFAVLLTACANNPTFDEGKKLVEDGRTEEGVLRMEQGVREKPGDIDARNRYFRERELLTSRWLATAESARAMGLFDEADEMYRRVFRIDPTNERAQGGLVAVQAARRHAEMMKEADALLKKNDFAGAENLVRVVLSENPGHADARALQKRLRGEEARNQPVAQAIKGPFSKPITLEFRDTPLKAAFEVMSRTAGINFVLDKDVKADSKVTLFVRNTSIEEALRLLLVTNQLERKLLNENSVLIYPNTAAKTKDYQETVVKTFYLVNADVKQAQTLVKTMIKSKDVFIDEKLNLLIVKDTPDGIRLAERLIESLDLALPEVMLEVEVLEVSRNRLLNLGVQFPDQIGYGKITPDITNSVLGTAGNTLASTTTFGGTLAPGNVDLHNRGLLTSYVANPAILVNLKKQDGDNKLLANPRIRVINREKAKIHIGDKLPVFTTTSTANVGVSAAVTYLDVGLKLEVEPRVYLDEDVEMKVALEVSSVVKEVPGPSNSLAYQVGTRATNTVLRLHDGETQILAGLINDEERSSANRVPGLGDLPILGRLFSNQTDSKNKTEIVLLITPHVVRNVNRPPMAAPTIWSGTDTSIGSPPLVIKPNTLRGVSGMGGSGARVPSPVAPRGPTPVLPAEGASEGAVPNASAQMQISAPAQIKAGQTLNISVSVNGGDVAGGQAEISADPNFFENPSATVTLSGNNGSLTGSAMFRLRPNILNGDARIEVTMANAADGAGAPVPVAIPSAQTVQIVP